MLGHYTTPPVPLRITMMATPCQRDRVLKPDFAPFAAARIAAAGPYHALRDVDDDAANRAVVEIALWRVVLADRARIVGMVGHQVLQTAGVPSVPPSFDQRF